VVAGIPSWCEADVIARHARNVDVALAAAFPRDRRLLANADNRSPDGTSARFMAAETAAPRVALRSPPGRRGKGYNFRELFRHALSVGADVLLTLDADLEAVPPEWIPALADPVLEADADVVVPVYPRHWYDGNLTNQVVAPLVAAVTRVPIRQPIAGEFAFSPRALEHVLSLRWPQRALRFAADLFVLFRALESDLSVVQVPLAVGKIHSWRSDTAHEVEEEMEPKFDEIAGTLLDELRRFDLPADGALPSFPAPLPLGQPPKPYDPSHVAEAAARAHRRFRRHPLFARLTGGALPDSDGAPAVDERAWASILARALAVAVAEGRVEKELTACLEALFLLRIATVLPRLSDEGVEPMVSRLAELLDDELRAAPPPRVLRR
jgi:hypothetical protein